MWYSYLIFHDPYWKLYNKTNGLYTETLHFFFFSDALNLMGRKFLKRNLTHLFCPKYAEIIVCHLHKQKHVYCKKIVKPYNRKSLYKSFSIPNGLWGEQFKSEFQDIHVTIRTDILTHIIQICRSIIPIKKGINSTNISITAYI